ncbi:uncharacterized protein LOC135834736 [Planococcus citri]|uniref:uncharacterized protein LOC135834736 n=1 Tax=Planococcus citri TaxID=170843 RepID=UPI0031F74BB1
MTTFHETVCICTIYILVNHVTNQYAFHLGQAQVRRKAPQNNDVHLEANALNDLVLQKIDYLQQVSHQKAQHSIHQQDNHVQKPQHVNYKEPLQFHHDSVHLLAKSQFKIDPRDNVISNLHPQNEPNIQEIHDHPLSNRKVAGIRMQRVGITGSRQTFKHFRYSRIRRYYTLSTASMTTWKKLNYTTRLMYTTPTTRSSPVRFTYPENFGASRRETVLHTRMTESDEIGRDRFMSGSIEYRDDSFDKPPTAMVAYDSAQASTRTTAALPPTDTTPAPTQSTKKISSELISLESSSEEKPSSSEDKEEVPSSAESEDYGNEKIYGEYGYHRKYNNTPIPITILTYANLGEVPDFTIENLTSKEIAYWEANASFIMDKYFPSSELEVVSNYSEENLVRSFFYHENIEPRYLSFYKWYYKVLTDPERLRVVYNRTVLEEPDYKNLSQYTPFAIPDDLQRYYMFINQMETEIEREKLQEERNLNTQREAEQNLDRILGDGMGGGGGRTEGPDFRLARKAKKKGDLDVSQILEMVEHPPEDSLMENDNESFEGFIDASRYKRDVSKFEPD